MLRYMLHFGWIGVVALSLGFIQPAEARAGTDDRWHVAREVERPKEEPDGPPKPAFGVVFDTGVPDGLQLAFAWRPRSWLRLHAGGGTNVASFGFRGGASWIPFGGWLSPALVSEVGYFAPGDLGGIVADLLGTEQANVGYTYVNLHLGLEIGSPTTLFFVRAGLSYFDAEMTPISGANDSFRYEDDVRLSGFVPSGKLGFVAYLE